MSTVRTTQGWVPNPATERIMNRVRAEDFVTDMDWGEAERRLAGPPIPDYVGSQIHGIEGGYSTPIAAITWDAVVGEIFTEFGVSEDKVRDLLPAHTASTPSRILDVACGTGESTRAWRRRFAEAEIVAVDVSPYMLAVAERKFADDPKVEVRCADAESLPYPDGAFDLATASLLFHELPSGAAERVLREMHRVVRPGGAIAVLEPYDRNGRSLDPIPFPEPYLREFLATDWDAAFSAAGFGEVRSVLFGEGWIRTASRAA